MKRRSPSRGTLVLIALFAAGCGAAATIEEPAVHGLRIQGATMVADAAFPYRVAAYELVFAPGAGTIRHVRRAALLVDLARGEGHARGFVEWGGPAEDGLLTVLELGLHHDGAPSSSRVPPTSPPPTVLALRVVVHEASGDVTVVRRR